MDLQKKIEEMEKLAAESGVNLKEDMNGLKKKAASLQKDIYSKLTPWQRVQLARHIDRVRRIISSIRHGRVSYEKG